MVVTKTDAIEVSALGGHVTRVDRTLTLEDIRTVPRQEGAMRSIIRVYRQHCLASFLQQLQDRNIKTAVNCEDIPDV